MSLQVVQGRQMAADYVDMLKPASLLSTGQCCSSQRPSNEALLSGESRKHCYYGPSCMCSWSKSHWEVIVREVYKNLDPDNACCLWSHLHHMEQRSQQNSWKHLHQACQFFFKWSTTVRLLTTESFFDTFILFLLFFISLFAFKCI